MTGRFTRLAELSVHGANVQEGQIVLVGDEIGLEEQARATAEAAYKRGAKFVDVAYFDQACASAGAALRRPQAASATDV